MLTRPRHGYMKIELLNGLVPGEGTSEDPAHLPDSNWIALYRHAGTPLHPLSAENLNRDFFAKKLAGNYTTPAPYDAGLGRAIADLNFETGRAERSKPFEIRVLKEGFGCASGSLLRSMFQNIRIKTATFEFTKQGPKGDELVDFQIVIEDGAISDFEVLQEGGGSKSVETLEYISIVAAKVTMTTLAVWADTDGEKKVTGGFNYEKREIIS
jgi:type VI protein secretion system component Hcp